MTFRLDQAQLKRQYLRLFERFICIYDLIEWINTNAETEILSEYQPYLSWEIVFKGMPVKMLYGNG